jgi:hypothetical protein
LTSAAPTIVKSLEKSGTEVDFTPTQLERGKNLRNGSYVHQLQVKEEQLDTWTVKHLVGASYSYETHYGYVQMSRENATLHHICDCFSGYVD